MTEDLTTARRTLHPTREIYRKAVRRDLLITVPLLVLMVGSQIVLQWMRASISGDVTACGLIWLYVALLVLGLGAIALLYRGMLRNSRIVLGEGQLNVTNLLNRTRTVRYTEVGTVIQTMVRMPAATLPMLFLLDRADRQVLTMYGTLWSTDAMIEVGAATGVAPTVFQTPQSYRELRKQYPHAVSWARANPILLAAVIAGGVLLLLLLVIIVMFTWFAGLIG
jgi:hypothetical protein